MTMPSRRDKGWAREAFRGLENLLLPSFSADMERLDEAGIRHDVRTSVAHGFFSTLCVLETGTPMEDAKRFVQAATEAADGDILVGVSLFRDSSAETLELLRHAESVGCSHAVLGFPLAFEPESEDDVLAYVREMAEATSLALVLTASDRLGLSRFHVSGLPLELYDGIADIDEVVALRIDTLEPGLMHECFDRYGDRLLVTSSNFLMLPLLVGLHGVQWSGGWAPEALQTPARRLTVECFRELLEGRTEAAMESYWRLVPAYRVMSAQMAPVEALGVVHGPLVKYYQWCVGGNGGPLREPAPRLFQRTFDAVRTAYAGLGIAVDDADEDFYLGRSALGAGARN